MPKKVPKETPKDQHFADRLAGAIDRVGTPLCVGIDPSPELLPEALRGMSSDPAELLAAFCFSVVDAVAGRAAAVKPQSACFERLGSLGVGVLEHTIERARERGLVVILDAKRGDIGSTARHYAAAAGAMGADAITLNPYMGRSAIEPFLDAGLGAFALARTSNPDSDEIQSARLESGQSVAEHVASVIADLGSKRIGARGLSDLGAVVGATKSEDGARLRAIMPDQFFLVPGVGAQGGTVSDVRPLLRPGAASPGELGVIVNASRSVIYAQPDAGESWIDAIARSASALGDELRSLVES